MKSTFEAVGFCKYCKESRMVEAPEDATQEQLDQLATDECTCQGAYAEREREQQHEYAVYEIENIIKPRSEAAAVIFRDNIENIQMGKIKQITATVITPESGDKWTLLIKRGKDGLTISAKTTFEAKTEVF